MELTQKIALLGGSGKLGKHFLTQALQAGYTVHALVRNTKKLGEIHSERLHVFTGDALNTEDVKKTMAGCDLVVSCIGQVDKKHFVMNAAFENILSNALVQENIPRCVFISSLGCGGTSWLIKAMLFMILGKQGFQDCENADARVRNEKKVPCVLIRPSVLSNKKASDKYAVSQSKQWFFPKLITRADLANFLLNLVENKRFDRQNITITGANKAYSSAG